MSFVPIHMGITEKESRTLLKHLLSKQKEKNQGSILVVCPEISRDKLLGVPIAFWDLDEVLISPLSDNGELAEKLLNWTNSNYDNLIIDGWKNKGKPVAFSTVQFGEGKISSVLFYAIEIGVQGKYLREFSRFAWQKVDEKIEGNHPLCIYGGGGACSPMSAPNQINDVAASVLISVEKPENGYFGRVDGINKEEIFECYRTAQVEENPLIALEKARVAAILLGNIAQEVEVPIFKYTGNYYKKVIQQDHAIFVLNKEKAFIAEKNKNLEETLLSESVQLKELKEEIQAVREYLQIKVNEEEEPETIAWNLVKKLKERQIEIYEEIKERENTIWNELVDEVKEECDHELFSKFIAKNRGVQMSVSMKGPSLVGPLFFRG